MKILMITPYLPYPLVSGGQIRTYNLLKQLAPKHDITLFCFIRKEQEKAHLPQLSQFCRRVEVVRRRPAWSFFNILLAGFSLFPFLISIYYSWTVKRLLRRELEESNYDLIHVETFYTMPNLPSSRIPVLLVEQTIEFLVYQHFVENFKWFFLKPFLYIDVFKIKFWERFFWKQASRVVAMSEADQKVMQSVVGGLVVNIVPNGVDVEFFSGSKRERPEEPTILFVGNFSWLQNREAATILVKEVWPHIRKQLPKAKIWIVGQNPNQAIKNLAGSQVKVDETVDDIRQAYRQASVLVAPIRGGGGTRYKILEAMAAGLPVVTTSIGIEGTGAQNGQQVIIEDQPSSIAQATIDLLEDRQRYERIAQQAASFIKDNYNWVTIAKRLDTIYQEVANAKA